MREASFGITKSFVQHLAADLGAVTGADIWAIWGHNCVADKVVIWGYHPLADRFTIRRHYRGGARCSERSGRNSRILLAWLLIFSGLVQVCLDKYKRWGLRRGETYYKVGL